MKALFFAALLIYFAAVALEFSGTAFKKPQLIRAAWDNQKKTFWTPLRHTKPFF